MSFEQRTRRSNSNPAVMHGIGTLIHKNVRFSLIDEDEEFDGHVNRADFIARALQIETANWTRWFPMEAFRWVEEI